MNILICSKLFFPENEIGAIRPTNFAKYLNAMGHSVTVLTGVPKSLFLGSQQLNDSIHIERVDHSGFALKLISGVENRISNRESQLALSRIQSQKKQTIINRLYQKFKSFRLEMYNLYLEIDWFLQAKGVINKKMGDITYDIVLSSFGPLGSHLIGRFVKKSKRANFWVADLRDIMHNEEYSKVINLIYLYFEKEMIKKADSITVISNGLREVLERTVGQQKFRSKNVSVVHNGYENEIETIRAKNNSNILKIAYTGSLYSGKRDMSLLFEAIKELVHEKKIERNKVEIHYAGTSSSDLYEQAYSHGIQDMVHDHGYLLRFQAIELQNSCDFLVVLSWNTRKEQGILSGKFFEYLQAFKPIIAIINGDLKDSELTKMVKDLNLGIACEYVRKDIDLLLLKGYLVNQYNNKILEGNIVFNPNLEQIKEFHYQKISHKLEKICQDMTLKSNLLRG
ncbi:glycosyltransferase family 4 protein [Ginsengibacter hankyongi]|uniref:Glycosyltransferase family 4 protein n=1 Tax=Ginsengibacter hankyongi TaxID=2607284 RepID=A0A5J5IKD1_9BACT|nr:glycosyltransferase [Ginsengibacter hankyongi]KAA9041469.1 glycosyltransferase family 4 protein [Ginsengibacter hankyongi]